MGVNIAARVAYLGVVARPLAPLVDNFLKVPPPANVDEWERLKQFGQDIAVAARACKAISVVFAEPRRANQWAYSDAADRVSLQTAAALALRAEGMEVVLVHAKTAASGLGFKGEISSMDEGLAALLGITPSKVKHWNERRPAFAVAAAIAREKWDG